MYYHEAQLRYRESELRAAAERARMLDEAVNADYEVEADSAQGLQAARSRRRGGGSQRHGRASGDSAVARLRSRLRTAA
ncbi:hypothetical protein ABZ832_25540 [Streptantibioticus parmotrematis]|uniref:hypothetical protein n=1 Tax=Streptantibioticus parmotrematis TaxID=2873249 RepID=UPI0033C51A09